MAHPVIETRGLRKTYNPEGVPVHAVNGIDLTIDKGEFTALVGPSGCGKTTLMNLIGGLDTPTEGSVSIDGEDISHKSAGELIDFRLHHIGFVFQAYNLIPVLTALENVSFVMLLQGVGRAERQARATELLEAVGLHDELHRRPGALSGGQQQRVAVARALASRPRFVLADEPTANLDSHATTELIDLMAGLNAKEHMTFLFATHDQRVIDRARRVVHLDDGVIVKDERRG